MIIVDAFTVVFSDEVKFANGGGVVNYQLRSATNPADYSAFRAKQFYKPGELPDILKNGSVAFLWGKWEIEKYKDKTTGAWIVKGPFINLHPYVNDDLFFRVFDLIDTVQNIARENSLVISSEILKARGTPFIYEPEPAPDNPQAL